MVALTRERWEKFSPDLGENLRLPPREQFQLEIAAGLSVDRMKALAAGVTAFHDKLTTDTSREDIVTALTAELTGLVRVVPPAPGQLHTIAGRSVATVEDYLKVLLLDGPDLYNVFELLRAVKEFNSINESMTLFFRRHSGGLLTTRAQSVEDSGSEISSKDSSAGG